MIMNWNPLVNAKFSLEDDFSLQDGYIEELKFESGKKRTWLRNSYIPRVIPSLNLLLDNHKSDGDKFLGKKTEFEEFENWYNKSLRYGLFPFVVTRIGFKRTFLTRIDEKGIYKFLPDSVKYDKFDGSVLATFGLEEEGIIPEVEYVLLATNKGAPVLTNIGNFIAVDIV